jgi:hypothetical protein
MATSNPAAGQIVPDINTPGAAPGNATPVGVIGVGVADGSGGSTMGPTGFNGVINATTNSINSSANAINGQLANFNPTDPGSLLQMQQQLANYNLAITVTSSLIKSLEGTVQAVAQNLK